MSLPRRQSLLLLAALLGLAAAGCGRPAFTRGALVRYNLTPEDVRHLQFYTSGEIVLRREVTAQERSGSREGLVVRDGTLVEEVVIPLRTPCVALRAEGDFILVGFARSDPTRSLWFAVKQRTDESTPLEERRYELVHLANAPDEPGPFEPRYAKGYLLNYAGREFQLADGKMWDIHLLYDEGSHIRQRNTETPPGWKQTQ